MSCDSVEGLHYICDKYQSLILYVNNVSADLYADDTTLYDVQNSVEMIEHNLQTGLNQLHIWCKSNGMVLNSAKTKVMLITTCQKRQRLASSNLHLIAMNL